MSRLFTTVFCLGAALAGAAGVIGGPIMSAYPGLDADMLPLALIVVILGGVGSLVGAFIGAFITGFVYTFGVARFPDLAYVILFLPMILVIAFRPQGVVREVRGMRKNLWVVFFFLFLFFPFVAGEYYVNLDEPDLHLRRLRRQHQSAARLRRPADARACRLPRRRGLPLGARGAEARARPLDRRAGGASGHDPDGGGVRPDRAARDRAWASSC